MSRDTLKGFLSSKSLPTDSLSYVYDKEGEVSRERQFDLGTDAETGEPLLDLDNEPRGLLGDYLNYIIENSNTIFRVNPGNERAAPTNRGDSLVLAEEQGAESVFVESGTEHANVLGSYSNSQYFDAAGNPISDLIDKTGNEGHSHNLLKDIKGRPRESAGVTLPDQEGEDNPVVQSVHSVLANNNRFANAVEKTAFSTSGVDQTDFETDASEEGTFVYQQTYGSFNPNAKVSIDQLKDVGASLLYKASGYDTSDQPGFASDVSALDEAVQSEAFVLKNARYAEESFEELDFRSSRAKYAAGAPADDAGNSIRDGKGTFLPNDPDADSSKTYGATYNPGYRFASPNRRIHKLQAAIACLALKKATSDFMSQIESYIKVSDLQAIAESGGDFVTKDKSYDGPGPYLMGAYNQLTSFSLDIFKKMLLVRTDYPYSECFEKGVEVFFGTDDDIDKIKKEEHIQQAPGYWLAIASSILKSYDNIASAFGNMESFSSDSGEQISILLEVIKSNKLIQFANAAATVGDVFFKTYSGLKEANRNVRRPHDVDGFPSTPATRVGKSRDTGFMSSSPLGLAWRQSSVPSMYLLPRNLVKASVDLNTLIDGPSPARGMIASGLVKNTYLDRTMDGSFNRIPNDVVKRLEDRLEAEYVPFYIQDLRTNEVLSFHAFLKTLTDAIKADYTQVSGYGRMDPVQIYKSTNRSISVGFTLYATSKEDFDEMWYKINKFVTLLYPQWTQGTKLTQVGNDSFVQPFSQVLGASPVVRLRIGDVVKSNYSRFNLARTFGIGDIDINPSLGDVTSKFEEFTKKLSTVGEGMKMSFQDILAEIFLGVMGTPLQYIPSSGKTRPANLGLTIARNTLSNVLINGFVNPLGAGLVLRSLTDPNTRSVSTEVGTTSLISAIEAGANSLLNGMAEGNSLGYHPPMRVLIKGNMSRGYRTADGKKVFIDRPIQAMVLKKLSSETLQPSKNSLTSDPNFKQGRQTRDNIQKRTRYKVKIIDPAAESSLFFKDIEIDHAYLIPDPRDIFMFGPGALLMISQPLSILDYVASFANDFASMAGVGTEVVDLITDLYATTPEKFMQPENNPFTRALEASGGRGLAGVIDGITFNWIDPDITWETDYNSRAPRGVEMSFNFSVIHDLPPGLDHSGYNKAPLYNVGSIMKEISGDARGDDSQAEFVYRNAGHGTTTVTGDD